MQYIWNKNSTKLINAMNLPARLNAAPADGLAHRLHAGNASFGCPLTLRVYKNHTYMYMYVRSNWYFIFVYQVVYVFDKVLPSSQVH